MKKLTQEEFIQKANIVHNYKYDYSLTNYINSRTDVKIICNKHGYFEQNAHSHLQGKGCPKCADTKYNVNDLINKFNKIHNNKYDYSLLTYKNIHSKIEIICPIHGKFNQLVIRHLRGHGCQKCANNQKYTMEELLNLFHKKHNNKYEYLIENYENNKVDINIICSIHGKFIQNIGSHLRGDGCKYCGYISNRLKAIERIENNKLNGNQLSPNFNRNACQIFDNIMKENNCYIQHAMNEGEYYIKELGYWLDGYDKENNIAYEYDEKRHFDKDGNLNIKDIIRQREIEYFLKCKFIRLK